MISFVVPEILLLLLIPALLTPRIRKFIGVKKEIGLLNILTAIILIIALAGPQMAADVTKDAEPRILVLEDSSESSSLLNEPDYPENVNIVSRNVDSDSKNFRSQIKSIAEENQTILFESDLQTNIEGLPQYFRDKNISSNVVRTDTEKEHSVRIEGPTNTIIGVENSFEAIVSSTSGDSSITVGFENQTIYDGEPPYRFNRSFDEPGYYKFWGKIDTEDKYSSNNKYFKIVRVREKPKVASIGSEGDLETQIKDFYNVENFDSIPKDIHEYDNLLVKELVKDSEIKEYLIEGGGMVYTGRDYSASFLPVEEAKKPSQTDAPVVILLMDISQNMGCPTGSNCYEESAEEDLSQENMAMSIRLAYQIVEELPDNARVSLMPYSDRVYSKGIQDPRLLGTHRNEVLSDIASIQPSTEVAHHDRALINANSMLSNIEAQGNAVMVSNGRIPPALSFPSESRQDALNEASIFNGRLITIGVDSGFQSPREEGEEFLRSLAERTEGGYYLDGRSDQLDIEFRAGGGSEDMQPLTITDSNHFITEGYSLQASVPQLSGSRAKQTASQLVSGTDGTPFLTTWRYGLGKVAAFSGDNTDLNSLMDQNPGLVGRTFSWTTKSENRELWVEGKREGDNFKFVSRKNRENFTRKSESRYERDINPESTGFYREQNITYSKNYRPEIERVGYNEDNLSKITVNGKVYSEENLDNLVGEIEPISNQKETYRNLTPHTLIAALITYLAFIGLRKRNGLA